MGILSITRILVLIGLVICLIGIMVRLREIMSRPFRNDLSRERGSARRGILYAFTLGMAPWEKESTRKHWVAYVRGILFHVGIFTAFGILIASFWVHNFPNIIKWAGLFLTGAGAVFGFAGIIMRLSGENERALSLPDDYFSVFLTSLFTFLAFIFLLAPSALPLFYLVSTVMFIYIPISKIRHCVYFFYSKFLFGYGFGRRGVIGQSHSGYVE
jgi:hypothetical protein